MIHFMITLSNVSLTLPANPKNINGQAYLNSSFQIVKSNLKEIFKYSGNKRSRVTKLAMRLAMKIYPTSIAGLYMKDKICLMNCPSACLAIHGNNSRKTRLKNTLITMLTDLITAKRFALFSILNLAKGMAVNVSKAKMKAIQTIYSGCLLLKST